MTRGDTVTEKLIKNHLVRGTTERGAEIALKIDQTLVQDSSGTLAWLEFEAMGKSRVQAKLSVTYVDHNTLQVGYENADDHRFLQGMSEKYGAIFSRPGNGICHQVHLERFGVPGETLLGADSHTPTCGALGMLAIGAGGLDVALAMAGKPFVLWMPRITQVWLTGALEPWVNAKDVILELLRRLTVKGGIGRVFEYVGPGVATLSVPERATIANMGTELGATTSVFPSDQNTLAFLVAQGRGEVWRPLYADDSAVYDETVTVNLSEIEPLVARPHMPDNVIPVRCLEKQKVDQIVIGSCTNSSYVDLARVARILKGKRVHPSVSLAVAPGSRQVLKMLAKTGELKDLIDAGARILECACGPCVGNGFAPPSNGVSLRTSNRNFRGRCGTEDAQVYLSSPEVAAASAITGMITDPRDLDLEYPRVEIPEKFETDEKMFIFPSNGAGESVEVIRGPNIAPLPLRGEMEDELVCTVVLKVGDNTSTDDIVPSGAEVMALRSNLPRIAEYVFRYVDKDFVKRAQEARCGVVVGGLNYGQGSSREHAALAPAFLGIRCVLAKSFARIHRANLINHGIIPLVFDREEDYDRVSLGQRLRIVNVRCAIQQKERVYVEDASNGARFAARLTLSERERSILLAGGLINWARGEHEED
ncbi:MAG TPA: aconitate hydratase [Clostridia bacterium]|nr:aconitate hydratase [Clostridia bacterium]